MKKILFVVDSLQNSYGTERAVVNVANELTLDGYSVSILSLEKQINNPKFLLDKSIHTWDLGVSISRKNQVYFFMLAAWRLFTSHKIRQYDFVIGTLIYINILLLSLLRTDQKIVVCEHVPYFSVRCAVRKVANFMYRSAHCVVCLTKNDMNYFKSKKLKVSTIPNFVNMPVIDPPNDGRRRWLFVGRFSNEKGVDYLMQILLSLGERCRHDCDLPEIVLIGDGPDLDWAKRVIASNALPFTVIFTGRIDAVEQYYAKAELLLVTSRYEGFGYSIVEAMTNSVPVIAFGISGGPSEILTNDHDGYLVQPYSVEEYVDRLLYVLKNPNLNKNIGTCALLTSQKYTAELVMPLWKKMLHS